MSNVVIPYIQWPMFTVESPNVDAFLAQREIIKNSFLGFRDIEKRDIMLLLYRWL